MHYLQISCILKQNCNYTSQNMKSLLLFTLFTLLLGVEPPQEITWQTLKNVEFKPQYIKKYDAHYLVPEFGKELKVLEGQKVRIKGHVIPMDVNEGSYILSANPYAACFYCGGAGPESVIELQFAEEPRIYDVDEWITFSGVFKLNDSDFGHMNYILTQVEEYADN